MTHGYLLWVSITHSKNLILLLNLIKNCMSARSAPFPPKKNLYEKRVYFSLFKISNNWYM